MFHRLQTRLFLTLISVAVIALAIVVMVAMQQTRRQFGAYVARDQMITLNQTAQLFEAPILSGSLTELDSLTAEVAQAYGITAYVYNTAGVIVATSDLPQVGQRVTAVPLPPVGLALKQDAPNGAASTVHFFPAPGNNQLVEAKIHMISSADIVSSRQWLAPDLSFTDQSFLVSGETSFPSITPSRDVAYTTVSLPDVLVDTFASQSAFIQNVEPSE